MKKLYCLSLLVAALFAISLPLQAQNSRQYVREKISYYGECRNVAITKYNGDLMLYGQNGYAASGCPSGLTDALDELNEQNKYINDVQLTDEGRWLVVYGDNGIRWNDIPYGLEQRLRQYNSNGEVITSVTFNDDNDWVVVTTEHISASDTKLQNWIKEGMDDYGKVWTVCLTDDACVVVFENGFRFLGNIPDDLRSALKNTSMDVYRLKISGSSWFFSDGKKKYQYHM